LAVGCLAAAAKKHPKAIRNEGTRLGWQVLRDSIETCIKLRQGRSYMISRSIIRKLSLSKIR
jgi:hypothetical protein